VDEPNHLCLKNNPAPLSFGPLPTFAVKVSALLKSSGSRSVTDPKILTEPVKLWLSSEVSPNLVDPESYNIDALTNSVWNSCAVIFPVTVKSPSIDAFPVCDPSHSAVTPVMLLPSP
jgi:hypothetical protein